MNLNHHLTHEQIIGYIYKTLNDADRENINHHLDNCQVCRAKMETQEVQVRRIRDSLFSEINNIPIPDELSFPKVSPHLEKRHGPRFWTQLSSAMPLPAALIGLIFAILGLWQTLEGWTEIASIPQPPGNFPALACFFFMFVSMDQFDRSFLIRPRFILAVLLALILWFGSFIIGLMNIIVIADLVIAGFLAIGGSPEGASVVAILAVILATMGYIGVVIGGADYHYKNIGQPGSWKLFIWTIFGQLFIMVLPYFLL